MAQRWPFLGLKKMFIWFSTADAKRARKVQKANVGPWENERWIWTSYSHFLKSKKFGHFSSSFSTKCSISGRIWHFVVIWRDKRTLCGIWLILTLKHLPCKVFPVVDVWILNWWLYDLRTYTYFYTKKSYILVQGEGPHLMIYDKSICCQRKGEACSLTGSF